LARKEEAVADVTRFLEDAGIDFDVLEHARTERAADEAAALGIGPEEVAKTLVLVASSGNVRAVLARWVQKFGRRLEWHDLQRDGACARHESN
jgi:uroporphyrinogen-III synthase